MKNKGVMISLAAILVIGILITISTHQYVEKNSTGLILETGAGYGETAAGAVADAAAEKEEAAVTMLEAAVEPKEGAAENGAMEQEEDEMAIDGDGGMADGAASHSVTTENGGSERAAGAMRMDAGPGAAFDGERTEGAAADEVQTQEFISPLDTTAEADMMDAVDSDKKAAKKEYALVEGQLSYYEKRLQELDIQIQKNKETQVDVSGNNSARSSASNELKLWDSELNLIYNAILEQLGQEDSQRLVVQQRAWLKERDSLAMEAAKKSPDGSSESIEYTISLTESTRKRAYELARIYVEQLSE